MTIRQRLTSFAQIPTVRFAPERFATPTDFRRHRKKILKKPRF